MKPRLIQPGETRYVFDLNESEAMDLVSGWVPPTVRSRALFLLDSVREAERMQASRPMEPTKKRHR